MKTIKGILRICDSVEFWVAVEDQQNAVYHYLHDKFAEFDGKVVEITIRECGDVKCEGGKCQTSR